MKALLVTLALTFGVAGCGIPVVQSAPPDVRDTTSHCDRHPDSPRCQPVVYVPPDWPQAPELWWGL